MVEATVAIEPDQTLGPGDLEEVAQEVAGRIEAALAGQFDSLPAAVRIEDVSIDYPEHVPFFPATFGEAVYQDPIAVNEAIQALRQDTPLAGLLYDCAGRAFRVSVWTRFQRDRAADRKVAGLWTLDPGEPAASAAEGEP